MTRREWIGSVGLLGAAGAGRAQQELPPLTVREHAVPVAAPDGTVAYRYRAWSGVLEVDLGEGERLELACVPGSTRTMGSLERWPDHVRLASTPMHSVSVAPFCLGTYEVTLGQWLRVSRLPRVARDLRPPFLPGRPDELRYPVEEGISFEQAEEFCARLGRHTGLAFRPPSEAEWEHACRAGTLTRYHFGDAIGDDPLGSEVISIRRFVPVGSKNAPNRYGLHDMHGGVGEWCADWEHVDYRGAPTDGQPWLGPGGRSDRRIHRGSFLWMGCAGRDSFPVSGSFTRLGVRVALTLAHGVADPLARTVLSAAAQMPGAVAPGQLVSVYGEQLGPTLGLAGEPDAGTERWPASLAGVEVYVGDLPAPLLYASAGQLNAVVPFGLEPGAAVRVVVRHGLQSAAPLEVTVEEASPGLFTRAGAGTGPAAALNEDGAANAAERPIAPGAVVTLYGTGFGAMRPEAADGELVRGGAWPRPVLPVRVAVGGVEAAVEYAGQAPELVAGVVQVNARLGGGTPHGAQEVAVWAGERRSRAGVTLFVG